MGPNQHTLYPLSNFKQRSIEVSQERCKSGNAVRSDPLPVILSHFQLPDFGLKHAFQNPKAHSYSFDELSDLALIMKTGPEKIHNYNSFRVGEGGGRGFFRGGRGGGFPQKFDGLFSGGSNFRAIPHHYKEPIINYQTLNPEK